MTANSSATAIDLANEVRGDPGRLAVVRATGLLDAPAEETFDALSRLAVTLIGAPVSFLSIVDEHRDFYKSQCGFPGSLAEARQLDGRTFCHYALVSATPLVIEDTHSSPIWRSVPTVDSLGVRAYLGVPVIVRDQPIGSFCVIDTQPRAWTSTAIETLVQISKAAAREIELRTLLLTTKAEAERANQMAKASEELWAIIVHDLRSPLQTIRLGVAALGRMAHAKDQSLIERVARAADSMSRLLDESLSNFTANSGRNTRRTTIAVAKLLDDSLDTMALVAERAVISLGIQCETAASISVEYAQMLRVLGNLIGNCIKYCPRGTAVQLRAEDAGNEIEIVVSDNGPGMSPEDQERAFERGWQGATGRARQDGAGLGLSIVRDLVSQNDGTVALQSEIGRGTAVSIRLPIALESHSVG
jgi:signal transduction histidine kinase